MYFLEKGRNVFYASIIKMDVKDEAIIKQIIN